MRRTISLVVVLAAVVTLSAGCGSGSSEVGGFGGRTGPPNITSLIPASGGMAGGTKIIINGDGLANTDVGINEVTIGGQPCTGVVVLSDAQIVAYTPAGAMGPADLQVTKNHGTGTLADGFTYHPAPTLTQVENLSVFPITNKGTRFGGQTIRLTGTGFLNNDPGDTVIDFGGYTVGFFTVNSDTEIECISPEAFLETPVDVTVTNNNGAATLANGFIYGGPPPTLTSITPNSGGPTGGLPVTLIGTEFTVAAGLPSVTFGGTSAVNVVRIDDNTLTCLTPPGAPGTVDVIVANGNGSTAPQSFTYYPPPTLTAITPPDGSANGGDTVTLTGTGFLNNLAGTNVVTFGGTPATGVSVTNDTTLTCVTPAGAEGFVNVTLSNSNGSATLMNGYEFTFAVAWDSTFGTATSASTCDDCFSSHSISNFTFPFYGGTYTNFTVGSNGTVGVGTSGTTSFSVIIPSHPHISPAQNDFYPPNAGTIYFKELTDRVVITYDGVGESPYGSGFITCQVVCHVSGKFAMMFKSVSAASFYTSVGPGNSGSAVDWTSEPACPAGQARYELFSTTDLQNMGLLFTPDGSGGYTTTLFPVP